MKHKINYDERNNVCRSIAITHRKGREERKADVQKSLRPLRSLRLIDFHGIPMVQGNKAMVVFQTGFTGCVLSFNPVLWSRMEKPQIHSPPEELSACYARGCAGNADECRSIAITHRKGREERKAEMQKSLRPLRSLRLIDFHGIPMAQENKAMVVFQTGFTGCVLSFNPVLWSRMEKPQIFSPLAELSACYVQGCAGSIKEPQINTDEHRRGFNNIINIFQPEHSNTNYRTHLFEVPN